MIILGIETSCDETAAAIVRDGTEIVSSVVASSQELHKKTGGIIPEQAAREQIKCIIPVVEEAMVGYKAENIDAIAVTYGPGLIGSLLVGVETAKTLAFVWKKPIIPVNHLIGHIYANFLAKSQITNYKSQINSKIQFPAMVLIVSGGHTELVYMKRHGSFKVIGQTRDDAAGEAFDKIARILGLNYPGGPAIQHAAEKFQKGNTLEQYTSTRVKLPRPMMNSGDLDFSFSGLKTSVLRITQNSSSFWGVNESETSERIQNQSTSDSGRAPSGFARMTEKQISFLAYEVQEAITDVLVKKTIEAAEKYRVKTIMLAGGVAANKRLREKMEGAVNNASFWGGVSTTTPESIRQTQDKSDSGQARMTNKQAGMTLSVPLLQFCTDNAVSIASAGFFNYKPVDLDKITVEPGLEIN